MSRRACHQLVLNLDPDESPTPPTMAPEGLLQALADLLLEALGSESKAIESDREVCDAAKNLA
jgi:hypothetical protein